MIEIVEPVRESYKIGDRIDCDGYQGSVRYVGLVSDTNGIWLGIDWDDPARGKHNGTYNGKEYFKTRYPTSGSFVRPGKVKAGITCPDSIKNRYGLINDELAGVDRDHLTSLKREMNAPFLEMVGFSKVNKKQSTFNQLKIVWLREQNVSSAGDYGELEELCPNVEELDISKNLFNSWQTIADICLQLKKLQRLDVSENYLPTKVDYPELEQAFINVNQLTMTKMNYDWSDIEWCTTLMFPSLKVLYVPFNNASILNKPIDGMSLTQLIDLSLENNGINDWEEILKLGELKSLEILNLNSNMIDKVRFHDNGDGKTNLFPALRQLHLSRNSIYEWRSISELEKLNHLEDLKLRDNPLLNNEKLETVRQLIIANISNLKLLNGTEITKEERKGAEYDYLKLYGTEWLQLNGDIRKKDEFVQNHLRFPMLIEKYGNPDIPSVKTDSGMKSDVIVVELIGMNGSTKIASTKKKLLKDMDVQKLMGILQRTFKTGGKILSLSFIQPNRSSDEIPLDKPLQKLSYYSIQNGDRILVRW